MRMSGKHTYDLNNQIFNQDNDNSSIEFTIEKKKVNERSKRKTALSKEKKNRQKKNNIISYFFYFFNFL